MPLPSTRAIPLAWSSHHRAAVEGAFNAKVTITDPSRSTPGAWDEQTGTYGPPTMHVVAADVPCRIQRLKDDRPVDHVEQNITIRLYLIQLPADTPAIETGFVAEVVECPNDPWFVGATLTASDVEHGSELFNRDVVWIHNQAPTSPAPSGSGEGEPSP